MSAEFIKLYEENPQGGKIDHIANVLRDGGLVIYPTDTVYGLGCDIYNNKAVERVKQIKGLKGKRTNLAFICYDLSHLSQFATRVTNPKFKLMKKTLPGPFTYILNASSKVPKIINSNKKTVGIRVPANNIVREIVRSLGNPIVSTSIRDEDEIIEYSTDPELIFEKFKNQVEIVIDGGFGGNVGSTIIDYTQEDFEIVRDGLGEIEDYL